jgi:hypothetical protein
MIIFLLLLFSSINNLSAKWGNPITVSSESDKSAYRAIIGIDGKDNIHIAWKDKSNYSNAGDDWDIFYKYKPKDGKWSTTEVVSFESIDDSTCLFMSVDKNGTVHVVWKDKTDILNAGVDYDIFYKFKPFNGEWSDLQIISNKSSYDCGCPSSTIDDEGDLFVVWSDWIDIENEESDWDIYFSKLKDDGNWIEPILISNDSNANSFEPMISVDSKNNIHILWYEKPDFNALVNDYDIFYRYRQKNGEWNPTQLVSTESMGRSTIPALAVDSEDTLHLAWIDKSNINGAGSDADIFYKSKPIDGEWSDFHVVSIESISHVNWPSITVDNNDTVHLTWQDHYTNELLDDPYDIVYKYKPKNGNWSDLELVSINSGKDSNWGSVATNSTNAVHVSWWDDFDSQWITYYNFRTNIETDITDNNEDVDQKTKNEEKDDYILVVIFMIFIMIILFLTFFYKLKIKKKK